MKITMYSGCTRGDKIDVDGIPFSEMSYDKQTELILKIIKNIIKMYGSHSTLRDLILSYYTDSVDLGECEQCGDYVNDYILEI